MSFSKTFMMKISKISLQTVDWNKYDPNASECSPRWAPIEDIKARFWQKILMFVISPNRRTFYFPELENLNFGD